MLHRSREGAPVEILGPEAQVHLFGEHPDTNVIGSAFVFEHTLNCSVETLVHRVKKRIESRLDLEPRLRARAIRIPDSDHLYALVHDQPIDIDAHVSVVAVDEQVDDDRFRELCLMAMDQPLNMLRPLWHITIVPRLSHHRAGVIIKVHHFIEDGVLAVASMTGVLIDADPDAPLREPSPYPVHSLPSAITLKECARAAEHSAKTDSDEYLGTYSKDATGSVEERLHAHRSDLGVQRSNILARTSDDRGIAVVVFPIDEVKKCQDILGRHVSINDVAVTITAMALQTLLDSDDCKDQRILINVPVSLSLQTGGSAEFDKYGAMMILDVPLDEPDPCEILAIVSDQSQKKKTTDAWAMAKIKHAASQLPIHEFKKISGELWSRGNFMFSNIPGPQTPFYLAGGRVTQWIGLGKLRGHAALRVIVLSYAGQISWSATYDRRVLNGKELEIALKDALHDLRGRTHKAPMVAAEESHS